MYHGISLSASHDVEESSREVSVGSGVPQGTVLGPLLFICHINDLRDAIKFKVADDSLLYIIICSHRDHVALLQNFKNLEEWDMRFNASLRQKSSYFPSSATLFSKTYDTTHTLVLPFRQILNGDLIDL